jgi:hypothetical protein
MQHLIEPNGTTLLVGAESNGQNFVAHEIVARALCVPRSRDGALVCLLAETKGEIGVFKEHIALWLRAREIDPNNADRVVGLPDYRLCRDGATLGSHILEACQGKFQSRQDVEREKIIVFLDLASAMLAARPGDHRLAVCSDLPIWLPNASVIITAHHGPDGMPAPSLDAYAMDRVYKVRGSNIAMNITLTPIKPPGDVVRLNGRIHRDGVVIIDEQEAAHA